MRIKQKIEIFNKKNSFRAFLRDNFLWRQFSWGEKVDLHNIKIIDSSFHNDKLKRRISEAPYIK